MTIFNSPYPSVGTIPNDLSLAQFVCSNPFNVPLDKVIIAEAEGDRLITLGGFLDDIKNVASGIRHEIPSQPAGIVAVISANTLEYASLVLGIIGAGMVPSLVNPTSTNQEVQHALQLVAPENLAAVFVSSECREIVLEGIKLCKYQVAPRIFSMDTAQLKTHQQLPLAGLTGPADKTLAAIYYSSGTTGLVSRIFPLFSKFAATDAFALTSRREPC